MEFTRRDLLKGSAALIVAASASRVASAADDPLPSWNEGPSKKAILDLVNATTNQGSPSFVPESERIATFDQAWPGIIFGLPVGRELVQSIRMG